MRNRLTEQVFDTPVRHAERLRSSLSPRIVIGQRSLADTSKCAHTARQTSLTSTPSASAC